MNEREKKKVLVVDDDESIRRLVLALLHFHGFEVDSAADGLEAIERLRSDDYDAIVLDLMMPHLDGFGVLDFLSEEGDDGGRVIILTASDSVAFRRRTVARVMRKPFDVDELISAVESCCELGNGEEWLEAWH